MLRSPRRWRSRGDGRIGAATSPRRGRESRRFRDADRVAHDQLRCTSSKALLVVVREGPGATRLDVESTFGESSKVEIAPVVGKPSRLGHTLGLQLVDERGPLPTHALLGARLHESSRPLLRSRSSPFGPRRLLRELVVKQRTGDPCAEQRPSHTSAEPRQRALQPREVVVAADNRLKPAEKGPGRHERHGRAHRREDHDARVFCVLLVLHARGGRRSRWESALQ